MKYIRHIVQPFRRFLQNLMQKCLLAGVNLGIATKKKSLALIHKTRRLLCRVPALHPLTFYSLYIVLVVIAFLGWLYFEHNGNFTWFQISIWLKNNISSVITVFSIPLVLILLLHRFICLQLSTKGIPFVRPSEFDSLVQFVFVTITLIAMTSFGIKMYIETIQSAVASHGCVDAVSITANTTWSTNQCHGDVTISNGATLTINGGITADLNSLSVGNGVTNGFITAKGDIVNNVGIVINIDGNFTSFASSNISANNQGFPTSNQGPGAGSNTSPKTGAGHGGQGGTENVDTTTAGNTYGSVTAPTTLGSSGSNLAGGGAVKLSVGGNATVNGNITADVGTFNNGGVSVGSGGSIWLNFTGGSSTLSGSGTISANGGQNTGAGGGRGGGGGRMAITGYTTNSHTGTISAYGGAGHSAGNAAAGTIYTKSTSETNGTLISDNGGTNIPQEARYTGTGTLTVDTLTIRNRGVIDIRTGNTVTATTTTIATNGQLHPHIAHDIGGSITVQTTGTISHAANAATETYKVPGLTVTNLTIDSGGSINLNGKGYTTNNSGPGAGSASPKTAAGHGGQGATDDTATTTAGVTYDSVTGPVNIGSSGTTVVTTDGDGGGAAKINISGNASISGTISADGLGVNNSGSTGGSGGSIWLNFTGGSSALSGSGAVSVYGGSNTVPGGNPGGGGRIAITGYASNSHSGTLSAAGGDGDTGRDGVAGTVFLKGASDTNGTLIVDNSISTRIPQNYRFTSTGIITVDTLTIRNGGIATIKSGDTVTASSTTIATGGQLHPLIAHTMGGAITVQTTGKISHPPNTNTETYKITNLTLTSLTVDSGGSVDISGKGYTTTYSGPGAGNVTESTAAGHGGQGGTESSVATTSGSSYDSVTEPVNIGSSAQGAGGGAVKLTISGNAVINGSINANSVVSSLNSGAGGAIWLVFTGGSSTLSGSGSITANGGAANSGEAQGGGGRIAITGYTSNTLSGVISAYSAFTGAISFVGGSGTVYTKSTSDTNGTLKIDNNSVTTMSGRYGEVGTTATIDTLLIQNGARFGVKSGGNFTLVNNLTLSTPLQNRGTFTHQGTLTIANSGSLVADSTTTLGPVTIQSGGKITHTANSTSETYKMDVSANSMTIDTGGSVDVVGLGYTGGAADAAGNGTGGGGVGGALSGGGGGGYGGTGTTGQGANGGAGGSPYGSSTQPVNIGSGGGGGDTSAGGNGGGAIKLTITNALTVNGTINANGTNGVSSLYGGGGGSGGSIYILASTLTCPTNSVTANGGNGAGTTASGGGGSGGRIALAIGTTYSCVPVATNGSIYEAPKAPTNLTASNLTSSTVTLTWTDNSTTETSFKVHDGSHNLIATKSSSTTATTGTQYSIEKTGLTPNTSYNYHVHADDGISEGFNSNTVNILTLAAFPGSVTLANHTNGSLLLTFSPTSNPANVEYTIRELITGKYLQDNGTLGDTTVWQTYDNWGGASGITVTGLTKATLYTFGVKARNSGLVETTYISNSSVDPNTPLAPVLFDPASTEIGVAVEPNSNPSAVEFAIYESTTNQYISYVDSFSGFATLGSTPLWKTYNGWGDYFGVTLRGLTPLTTYKFSVKARYPGGTETGFGPESEITTNTDPVAVGSSSSGEDTSGGLGGTTGTATSSGSSTRSSGGSSGGTTQEEEIFEGGGETEVVFAERKRRTFFDYWNDVWYQQQYDWWDSNSMFSGSGWFGSTVGGSIGWGLLPWGMGRSQGGFSRSTIYRSQGGFGTGGGCGFSCIGGGSSGGFGGGGGGAGGGGGGGGAGGSAFSGMSSALRSMMRLGGGIPGGFGQGLPDGLVELTSSMFGGGYPSGSSSTDLDRLLNPPSGASSIWELYKKLTTDFPSFLEELFGGPDSSSSGEDPSSFLEKLFEATGIPAFADSIYDVVVVGLFVQQYTGLLVADYYAGFTPSQTNLIIGAVAVFSLAIPVIQAISAMAAPAFQVLATAVAPLSHWIGEILARIIAALPGAWSNVLSWRKKRKKWGRVISSLTYKPIKGARVALYNAAAYNRLVDQMATGRDGQFGFLVREGDYTIVVSHLDYKFPATLVSKGYHGQALHIKGEEVVKMDIPLDPLKIQIQHVLSGETVKLFFAYIRRPLLFLGSVLSIYNISHEISLINILFILYYIILWIFELQRHREVKSTITVTDAYNRPLPFAIVRLTNRAGEVILAKATSEAGKVFVLAPTGQYELEVVPPAALGLHDVVQQSIMLREGQLNKPLLVRFNGVKQS